ncbi:MAG: PAQR family membrane homeostasis protein TrhA [Sporichthyaceae bacterium]
MAAVENERHDTVAGHVHALADRAEALAEVIKPKLRGWLHLGAFPASVVAGIVLVVVAPNTRATVACAIFAASASLLFGVSALYHRGTWSPRTHELLKRLDHANIFLIIAGSYTPFAMLDLENDHGSAMLWIVWTGAALGVTLRSIWIHAARWLSAPVYLALGWTAVFFLPDLIRNAGIAAFVLLVVGGVFYSIGGLIYGIRWPNPSPRWFGFHEVFHLCTVIGWIVHYVAVSITAYTYL